MQKIETLPLNLLKSQGDQQFPSDNEDLNDCPKETFKFQNNHQVTDFLKQKQQIKKKKKQFLGMKLTDQLQNWNTYLNRKFVVGQKQIIQN